MGGLISRFVPTQTSFFAASLPFSDKRSDLSLIPFPRYLILSYLSYLSISIPQDGPESPLFLSTGRAKIGEMFDMLALQCLSRDSGESREVVLAKKELQVSEERIKGLEESMRSRAEVQELMEAEQQQMLRQ